MEVRVIFRVSLCKTVIYCLAGLLLLAVHAVGYAHPSAPNVQAEIITVDGQGFFRVSWGEVTEADRYKVYASDDPKAEDWGEAIADVDGNTLLYTFPVADEAMKFFYVSAVQDIDFPEWMVYVQGGRFNPQDGYTVTLSAFYISKYLVTQSEYEEILWYNPSNFHGNPQHPVETVSWFDAIEYCNRLSMSEDLPPCYRYADENRDYGTDPDDWPEGWNQDSRNHTNIVFDYEALGYRLPTEMEWEFSARGGLIAQNAETFETTYSGSNEIDLVVWYQGNSNWQSQRIATKQANELGTFDMSGNVYEWCWDIYDEYTGGQVSDPRGPNEGENRVRRGGSWHFAFDTPDQGANRCEVDNRFFLDPERRVHHLGIRVVRNAID